ncbi:hypothetical protein E7Z59_11915 [Robertkochia marina]|uniref:Lipoprotein n=1 Tax=Robertkochia marina TaxID=1227945 RepID=A0A4S3LZD3_9FLAO|nr:hypothetical protein [Robertkochia marina]THD66501.1 hypothetical protein E7Z59_11915 [Robertkochia marina]TRZ45660.1 hypothetical protein D3A96_06720 [Robertkochia marina]
MKINNLTSTGLIALLLVASISSCSKTPVIDDEAICDTFLLGLSYQCTDTSCIYVARIENKESEGAKEIEIDQTTYEHYKTEADAKQENVCWEGMIE